MAHRKFIFRTLSNPSKEQAIDFNILITIKNCRNEECAIANQKVVCAFDSADWGEWMYVKCWKSIHFNSAQKTHSVALLSLRPWYEIIHVSIISIVVSTDKNGQLSAETTFSVNYSVFIGLITGYYQRLGLGFSARTHILHTNQWYFIIFVFDL